MKGLKSDEDSEKTHLCTEELTISGQSDHYWTNLWRDQIGAEGVTLSGVPLERGLCVDVTLEKLDDSGAEGATRSWVQTANLSGKRTETSIFHSSSI